MAEKSPQKPQTQISDQPKITKKPRRRKIASTADGILVSVAYSRKTDLTLLWGARGSPHIHLTDSVREYSVQPFLDALPIPPGLSQPWPEVAEMLRKRLAIRWDLRRVSYLLPSVAARSSGRAPDQYDILERVADSIAVESPSSWGFFRIPGGSGPLPHWLDYLHNPRGACQHIRRLYGRVARLRAPRVAVWGWRHWGDVRTMPRIALGRVEPRGVSGRDSSDVHFADLRPEIWVRRRIARRSETVSLSLFGVAMGSDGKWQVYDLTAPLAVHVGGVDRSRPWTRGQYLVERGDGLEWIVLKPSVDGGDPPWDPYGEPYEGSPARHLLTRLREIWPSVRVRWILDDKPFPRTGKRSEGDLR